MGVARGIVSKSAFINHSSGAFPKKQPKEERSMGLVKLLHPFKSREIERKLSLEGGAGVKDVVAAFYASPRSTAQIVTSFLMNRRKSESSRANAARVLGQASCDQEHIKQVVRVLPFLVKALRDPSYTVRLIVSETISVLAESEQQEVSRFAPTLKATLAKEQDNCIRRSLHLALLRSG